MELLKEMCTSFRDHFWQTALLHKLQGSVLKGRRLRQKLKRELNFTFKTAALLFAGLLFAFS